MAVINQNLQGNVCLVTGAARGIGQGIARALAMEGAKLAINYHNSESEAVKLMEELRKIGVPALAIKADVSRESDVEMMFARVENELGEVSMLVNNAGISLRALLPDTSVQQWDRVIDTNLKGPFLCCRRALPNMIRQQFGRIVNVASIWGLRGAACESVYAASKGGLIALTKSLARELAPSGITVNAVAPGPITTDMLFQELDEEERVMLAEQIPANRLGRVEDVAAACAYLLSKEASYVNGQILSVDGAWNA
ncbi:MAG: SDR family oxidoreductase [Syntrophomonas sp.]